MNKKGFIFVETIVTLTILISLLLALYTVFSNLLQKERVISEYDKNGDVFALFYYKEYLNDSETVADESGNVFHEDKFGLGTSEEEDNSRCNIAIIRCSDFDDFNLDDDNNKIECSTVSQEFIKYKEYVSCPNNSSDKYIILGEFYDGNTYTYAHIYDPNR